MRGSVLSAWLNTRLSFECVAYCAAQNFNAALIFTARLSARLGFWMRGVVINARLIFLVRGSVFSVRLIAQLGF